MITISASSPETGTIIILASSINGNCLIILSLSLKVRGEIVSPSEKRIYFLIAFSLVLTCVLFNILSIPAGL